MIAVELHIFYEMVWLCGLLIVTKLSSSEMINFRPILVLPVLSKVLQRLVYDQLISYLLKHILLYNWQSGFRPPYSMQEFLFRATNSWCRAIDESKFTAQHSEMHHSIMIVITCLTLIHLQCCPFRQSHSHGKISTGWWTIKPWIKPF